MRRLLDWLWDLQVEVESLRRWRNIWGRDQVKLERRARYLEAKLRENFVSFDSREAWGCYY